MKALSPDRVVLVSVHPNVNDAFVSKSHQDTTIVNHSPSTVSTSRSFDYHDITVVSHTFESDTASEKSKVPIVSFKLRSSPERRKSKRRTSHSQSLPPLIARTTSFDFLEGESSEIQTIPDENASIPMPDLGSDESKPAEARPVFRAPLPRRKSKSSPVKKTFLSKSLTLMPNPASLINDLETSLSDNKIFDTDTMNKPNTWFPLERSRSFHKKSVRFSNQDQIHHIHYDWSNITNYFYSSEEIVAMKSARYEDAAMFREEAKRSTTTDDLDVSRRQSVLCLDTLLNMAFHHPDNDDAHTSIRGIEHFVFPELQQEMIRKKKEVHVQVINFVKSKKPDPQGWRLANHSRMYSQWARDVALEKGQAYKEVGMECENSTKSAGNGTARSAPSLRRKDGNRRMRRNSMCASMPTGGEGAAAAARVQMQFFSVLDETTKSNELQLFKQDDDKEELDQRYDESREELEEA